MKSLTATPVLAPQSQLGKELSFDFPALGCTPPGQDDQSITRNCDLQRRDLNHACTNKDLMSSGQTLTSTGLNIDSDVGSMSHSEAGYSPSVSERSLLTDLTTTGFRLVWDYADIGYASYIALRRTSELWANITANARGRWKAEEATMTLDICYGCLKISIAGLIDAISWQLVAEFAAEMLLLSRLVVFVAFRVILFANWAAMVITLTIVAEALGTIKPQQLITGP